MLRVEENKKIKIRNAVIGDIEAITRIYNHAVVNTTATFDTRPKTVKSREKWFGKHSGRYPIIVAEDKNTVVGWASLSQWSDRCAYGRTAEVSVYVDKDNQGLGAGSLLMSGIVELARKNKFHVVIARIAGVNEVSVNLHQKYGFFNVGVLKEVGFKFNCYIDIRLMQLILEENKED